MGAHQSPGRSGRTAHTLVVLAALLLSLGLGIPAASSAAPPTAVARAPAPAPIPNTECLACHATGLMGAPKVNAQVLAHSVHASLACVSCHTSIKQIPHPVPVAPVVCARCHETEGHQLATGSHAPWMAPQGTTGRRRATPTCITCHGTHDIQPVTSRTFRRNIVATCASCHARAYRSYMLTPHGQAAALGMKRAPTCITCHNPHSALPPSNPLARMAPGNRLATCQGCHSGASANLIGFNPHPRPDDPRSSQLLTAVHYFMVVLLVGVFGFFGLHTLLWLQRSLIGRLRGELPALSHFRGPYIQRFTVVDRLTHLTVILSFMLLSLTGLALMHPETSWARAITGFFGGPHTMSIVHIVNGAITFGYFFFHICYIGYRVAVKKERFAILGEDSLVPNWNDIRDIGRNFRWFLYLGPQPRMGRWTYWEKFDYWAVFWGVAIIGVSGLMLAAPVFFARFVPGIWLNVALVVHSEEALLATGFIFIFHFFHNHLRPEKFPIDVSILTGRVPLDRFKEERPRQYQQLLEEGRLERSIVPPPSPFLTMISVIFGLAVVVTGVTLILLVIFAG